MEIPEPSPMSKERGRCRDTLTDALSAVGDALEYVEKYDSESTRALEVKVLFRSYLLRLSQDIRDLQAECSTMDHSRVGDKGVLYHCARVDEYVNAPVMLSRYVLLGALYVLQQRESDENRDFAECLLSSILDELTVYSVPLVVFGDSFEALDMDSHWMVSIPIVFRKRHRAWWALAHEVGHAVQHRATTIDTYGLYKRLTDFVRSEVITEDKQKEVQRLLVQWAFVWMGELLADYVGLSLFGLYYLAELRHLDAGLDFGTISTSHPPLSFRVACLRAILFRREPAAKIGEGMFEAHSPVPKGIDPLAYSLVTEKAVQVFADWLVLQPLYHDIRFHWSDVLDAWQGKAAPEISISTIFAALGLFSIEEDVSEFYEVLRKKCADKRVIS